MRKTDCFAGLPSTYLAHHELESDFTIVLFVIVVINIFVLSFLCLAQLVRNCIPFSQALLPDLWLATLPERREHA